MSRTFFAASSRPGRACHGGTFIHFRIVVLDLVVLLHEVEQHDLRRGHGVQLLIGSAVFLQVLFRPG